MSSIELPLIKDMKMRRVGSNAYGRDEFISCCSRRRVRKQHHDCDQRPIFSQRTTGLINFLLRAQRNVFLLFVWPLLAMTTLCGVMEFVVEVDEGARRGGEARNQGGCPMLI